MTEKMVTVELSSSIGLRGGPLYGPGRVAVPESTARALGLAPVAEDEGAEKAPAKSGKKEK